MKGWLIATAVLTMNSAVATTQESLTVYHDPNCGCCSKWVEYMESNGFDVTEVTTMEIAAYKDKMNVPANLHSCHTAVLENSGQVIEGHVPATAVQKLIASPDIRGISAPGMPMNAPGMGALDGSLVTVDFHGRQFSLD